MKKAQSRADDISKRPSSLESGPLDFATPYDEDIPHAEDPIVRFYIDCLRVYLGLFSASLSLDDALNAVEVLRKNPEFIRTPTDPTLLPINEETVNKIIANLQTLKRLNLITRDAIRSAFNFSFLAQDAPVSESDLAVLRVLADRALESLVGIGDKLQLNPRTVARAIERLENRNRLRFSSHMDATAFGIQPFILFFSLAEGIEWDDVEDGISIYPFTKNILKTSMTDLGYISFMVPGPPSNYNAFRKHIEDISSVLFEYSNLHRQVAVGNNMAFSLFDGRQWEYPEGIGSVLDADTELDDGNNHRLLPCEGPRRGLVMEDFLVLIEHRVGARQPPRVLSSRLRARGWDLEAKEIANSLRKLNARNMLLPFIALSFIGLSTNLCFEIVCDDDWRQRILASTKYLPSSYYYLSQKGIIVWAHVPSNHQVEYYQLYRSLVGKPGVKSVQPIMTLLPKGSRTEFELIRNWKFAKHGWTVDSTSLDLTSYLL
ncbi:MAG: hypothetical protein EAX95_10545 [Candidatus Thorarchaeota archaeon]|nr:hypothetical protein [Candidatus Thorarchaeota archaeon]